MVRQRELRCDVAEEDAQNANIVASMRSNRISYLLTHDTADFARSAPWIDVLPLVP